MFDFFTDKKQQPVKLIGMSYQPPTQFERKTAFDEAVKSALEARLTNDIYEELVSIILGKEVVQRSIAAMKVRAENHALLETLSAKDCRLAVEKAVGGEFNPNWMNYHEIRLLARKLAQKELE